MSDEFCQECGAKITGKTGFCSECGAPINIKKISNNIQEANEKILTERNSKLKKITIIGYVSSVISPLIYLFFYINWQNMGMFKDWIMLSVPLAIIAFGCGVYVVSRKSEYRKHGIIMLAILIVLFWISAILYAHSPSYY